MAAPRNVVITVSTRGGDRVTIPNANHIRWDRVNTQLFEAVVEMDQQLIEKEEAQEARLTAPRKGKDVG